MTTNLKNQRLKKIEERCHALAEILKAVRPIYRYASSEEKRFIETIIGAAIWYIPAPPDAWTGYISAETVKLFGSENDRPTISEEHVIPRKIAARKLLTKSISGRALMTVFCKKYCKIHYITPRENKILMRFQKEPTFIASSKIYQKAGIRLLKITSKELSHIKRRDMTTMKNLLQRSG